MRTVAKAKARKLARGFRWELVHAAGCVFREDFKGRPACATMGTVNQECVDLYLDEARKLGVALPVVRVPRSFRAILGRTVGGPRT